MVRAAAVRPAGSCNVLYNGDCNCYSFEIESEIESVDFMPLPPAPGHHQQA